MQFDRLKRCEFIALLDDATVCPLGASAQAMRPDLSFRHT
jgi:hypothetical protein